MIADLIWMFGFSAEYVETLTFDEIDYYLKRGQELMNIYGARRG